ncbi:hypothetical protein KEM48_004265 [Puccinia striiformis f. sp. tritici PST-130]|nr:hypothetical protein KEM48_004265 [Puccinia striiformis f. sp. tritici PST-130]
MGSQENNFRHEMSHYIANFTKCKFPVWVELRGCPFVGFECKLRCAVPHHSHPLSVSPTCSCRSAFLLHFASFFPPGDSDTTWAYLHVSPFQDKLPRLVVLQCQSSTTLKHSVVTCFRSLSLASPSDLNNMRSTEAHVECFLSSLGLSDYLSTFLSEGFDTIEAVRDITEEDLEQMQVKRGHRRVLQRALGKQSPTNGLADPLSPAPQLQGPACSSHVPMSPPPFNGEGRLHREFTERRSSSAWEHESSQSESSLFTGMDPNLSPSQATFDPKGFIQSESHHPSSVKFFQPPNPKRRYRRHPKPEFKKPLSAYVMFSNTVREQLKGQQISFTEIARTVGERWKTLERSAKEAFEREASEQKDRWTKSMLAYKRTHEYEQHRRYLQQFKDVQQARSAAREAGPSRLSNLDCSNTRSLAMEWEVNNDSREGSGGEAEEGDDMLSHSVNSSSASMSAVTENARYTNKYLPDAFPSKPPTPDASAYLLPPPLLNNSRTRPTIPNLCTLDKHLTESQTLFFKSHTSVRNNPGIWGDTHTL